LREIACDAAVTRLLRADAPAYGGTLGRLATAGLSRPPVSALGFLGGPSEILHRLERIMRPGRSATAGRPAAAAALLLALLACGPAFESPELRPIAGAASTPPGCWQLRFEVMKALVESERSEVR
jgi:beta-lactamase regulating signal transducer with metallopeptidase domain